jgi:N-acetylmuramic acid 6-phosphate etherase
MNAGTAQRIALNLLSTLLMIRLGRIYRGMMVEVQASNAKLAKRREKMLSHLTGQNGQLVRDALQRSNGSVKLAVLLLLGCDQRDAEAVLERVGGRLRLAIDLLGARNPTSLDSGP